MCCSVGDSLKNIIESIIGMITDNLELVIANPVPARLIANANKKNVMTNKNPSPAPYKSV